MYMKYNFVTTAYNPTTVYIVYDPAYSVLGAFPSMLDDTATRYRPINDLGANDMPTIINKPIIAETLADAITGDGTLTFYITYRIVTE